LEKRKKKIDLEGVRKLVKLFSFISPFKLKFAIGLIFLLLTSVTALLVPSLIGKLIDAAKMSNQIEIDKIGLYLLILFILQAIFSYFRISIFVEVTEKVLAGMRRKLYEKMLSLPMEFYVKTRVGELTSRMSNDVTTLQEILTTSTPMLLRQIIIIVGGIVLLAVTSVKLTLIVVATIPIIAILAWFFGKYVRKVSKELQDTIAIGNTIVEETLQGIQNVKAFTNELFEKERYSLSIDQVLEKAVLSGRLRGAFASFIILFMFGVIVFVIWYGVKMVNSGELSIGVMLQFLLYSIFIGGSIGGAAEVFTTVQRAIGSSDRILEILAEDEEVGILNQSKKQKIDITDVQFQDVSFSYPNASNQLILNKVNFSIQKGEKLALVGASGAGKSTIINLLYRFYKVNEGQILINDKSVYDFDLQAYRNELALVPQDVYLFGGSILENIKYGNPNASFEEIKNAAQKANALEFIDSFNEGFDTIVGERGIKLSGGQKQRIAIARALLKNPSILILDEATSSLDSESEKLVQDALDNLMVDRTSVIIAHRLSTVRNVNKIIVLKEGKIVESGNHNELIQIKNGYYKSLCELQFGV
jgi:ABC-type multidrug transport system fused ATPase/permease subunit